MADPGYVAAGYLVAAVGIGGYVAMLFARARRARARADAVASRRPSPPRRP